MPNKNQKNGSKAKKSAKISPKKSSNKPVHPTSHSTSHSTSKDKRHLERVPVQEEVQITFSDFESFSVQYAENISTGGMYLRANKPLPANTILHFRLQIKDINQEIIGKAVVVWTKEILDSSSTQSSGMGLKFLRLEGDSEAFIRDFIGKHTDVH